MSASASANAAASANANASAYPPAARGTATTLCVKGPHAPGSLAGWVAVCIDPNHPVLPAAITFALDDHGHHFPHDLVRIIVQYLQKNALFGPEVWAALGKKDVARTPFYATIDADNQKPCRLHPNENSISCSCPTILMPEGMTLNEMARLTQTSYRGWDRAITEHGDVAVKEAYWFTATTAVIDGSLRKTNRERDYLVARIPNTDHVPLLLEMSVTVNLVYFKQRIAIFQKTWSICQESTDGARLAIGGFVAGAGLHVRSDCDFGRDGVGVVRKSRPLALGNGH